MLRRLHLVAATALVAALAFTASATAYVAVEGTGEPAFTKGTTNTVFGRVTVPAGVQYRLRTAYRVNSVQNGNYDYLPAGSNNDVNPLVYTGQANFVINTNWVDRVSPLQSGSNYNICSSTEQWLGFWAPAATDSCADGAIAGKRTNTTIDNSRPTVVASVNGTDTFTKNLQVNLRLDYQDSISPPWPATYTCIKTAATSPNPATACNGITYDYQPVCSNAANGANKINYSTCTYTAPADTPDGPITFCGIASDSAILDNPSNADQFAGFTSSGANLSDPACGYVSLDRTAPQVQIGGGAATAFVGDLLSFSASATDAGSGTNGQYTWTWGDNTANGSGVNASHTFTQAGTYQVTLGTADAVGNAGTASKAVVVSTKPTSPTGGGAGGAGGGGGPSTGGGTATGGGGTVTPPPSESAIAKQVGASGGSPGATQTTSAGALDVLTAKKVKITAKLKALPMALTAETAGKAQFALVRSGRIAAQGGVNITKPGTLGFKLKLPKKMRAGSYSLRITFTPAGTSRASVKTIRITFTATKKARRSMVRPTSSGPRVSAGVPASPVVGTHP